MPRGGQDKSDQEGTRRCLVTREPQPKGGLIRFVVGPDGTVVPDIAEKLPGRGMWVAADGPTLHEAVKRKAFNRGAKRQVAIPADLPNLVEGQLAARMVNLISLARKAGQAVAGFEKVKSWLDTGQGKVLIQAVDGSARGKTKLRPPDGADSYINCLTGSEIGLAFGRENVIHAALATGGLSTRIVEDAKRLSGVRSKAMQDASERI
jgi:predicted RNA-binding protein YlxR (DUF448 family)